MTNVRTVPTSNIPKTTVDTGLPFRVVSHVNPLSRYTAFIYGFAGSGKTYLARTLLNTPMAPVLVCSCDEGHLTLRDVMGEQLVVTPTTSIVDFNAIYDYLLHKRHPFKTVFIDNITELYRNALMDRASANAEGKANRSYYTLTQQDYGEARLQLLALISDFCLELKGLNIIITALANRVTSQSDSSIDISLAGKVAYEIPAYADIVGYLSKEQHPTKLVREWMAAGKPIPPERRVLQVDSTANIPAARNRGGYFKESIYNPSLYEIFKVVTSSKQTV